MISFEVKEELKILGVILQPNLKWAANSAYICKKAYKNMWAIRRMKILGMDAFTIVDYYMKESRHNDLFQLVRNKRLNTSEYREHYCHKKKILQKSSTFPDKRA